MLPSPCSFSCPRVPAIVPVVSEFGRCWLKNERDQQAGAARNDREYPEKIARGRRNMRDFLERQRCVERLVEVVSGGLEGPVLFLPKPEICQDCATSHLELLCIIKSSLSTPSKSWNFHHYRGYLLQPSLCSSAFWPIPPNGFSITSSPVRCRLTTRTSSTRWWAVYWSATGERVSQIPEGYPQTGMRKSTLQELPRKLPPKLQRRAIAGAGSARRSSHRELTTVRRANGESCTPMMETTILTLKDA